MTDQFLTDLISHMKAFARARYICALTNKTGVSQITLKAADLKSARREVKDFLKEHPTWDYGYIKERSEDNEGVVFVKVATIKGAKNMSKKITETASELIATLSATSFFLQPNMRVTSSKMLTKPRYVKR